MRSKIFVEVTARSRRSTLSGRTDGAIRSTAFWMCGARPRSKREAPASVTRYKSDVADGFCTTTGRNGLWRGKTDMCGRYTLLDDDGGSFAARITDRLAREFPGIPVRTGEIFPGQTAPILASAGLTPAIWGFPLTGKSRPLINARSETVREKPAFATSFRLRRCAVPCTGFFEWDAHKTKYRFRLPGCGGAYLGGIFRECDSLPQFVILTAEANDSVRPIHERMPVILPAEAVGDWLADEAAAAAYMRAPLPSLLCDRA